MFKEELKKLYFKQFGLILAIFFIIGEVIFVNFLYPKREFTTEVTKRHFYEYMGEFSGELTPEKEAAILAEQERIVDARNAEAAIEKRLLSGEYSSEDEFIAEYTENHLITERKEAFDLIFEQYSYALESPNDRYLTVGNYSGLGMDFPDILLLALVIFMTAILFLNEESSGVITFVRISANGKQKTLWGKVLSLFILILFCQIFRTVLEFFVMISRGNFRELSYPIRTLEFFQGCPYNISILQGFLAISALRFLGYLFVAALVILLSVTLRKALFTVFIPSAACLLQQFAFDPATPAYYIPTGFLRGVGYFRGDVTSTNYSGEEVKLFSKIPLSFLIILVIITLIFIAISIMAAYNYYTCKSFRKLPKNILTITAVISLCGALSGCSRDPEENVKFNLLESGFFAQNNDYFYVSSGNNIVQISKNDGSELSLIHNVFDEKINFFNTPIFCGSDALYYLGGGDIYKISLSDYGREKAFSINHSESAGFLGINLAKSPELGSDFAMIQGFFTDEKSYFYVYNNRVLKDNKCIIDEGIYHGMVCFDGRKIYYINRLLQLKSYDLKTGETMRLPGEFVRSIYYDGARLLFSDKNGIFSLDTTDNSTEKISGLTAERITSDSEKIVYQSDGKLYLLGDPPIEIYDGNLETFSIISGTQKLVIVQFNGEYKILELPEI